MIKILIVFWILPIILLMLGDNYEQGHNSISTDTFFVPIQDSLYKNNISAFIWNSGVIDQDIRINNTPGFIWPRGTIKAAIFSSGLTIAAYVNNQIRMASASYKGEYRPGYCINGTFHTNNYFKIYKIIRGDNYISNPDWLNWGLMVPYGAPYIDANHNGTYDYAIDTPGIKGSSETIFICLTDADPTTHSSSEGFGGGTLPMGAEVHLTAWCYDNPGYDDMQFLKWVVINKNSTLWDSTYCSIYCDPDLGDANDDYIGCDSLRNLEYCYNSDNQDGDGTGRTYGANPPAVGIMFLNCINPNSANISLTYTGKNGPPVCEADPSTSQMAFNFMKGVKRDGTPFVIPNTNPPQITRYTYSGDPESVTGWTEYVGQIQNCDGSLTGNLISPAPPHDVRFLMSIHNINQRMNPGDTQVVQISQLIARGTNNLNSVTRLKQLADAAKQLCENNFVIGINPISTEIPKQFSLSQNYPNPFNPITKIKFDIPGSSVAQTFLSVYDVLGKEVAKLVNENLKPGTYSIEWNATNYPSGVYFYKLVVGDNTNNGFVETKKMVLLK